MARKTHQVRPTLLAVGEGDSEEAFLKYLRSIYCSGGAGVSVKVLNAHGKGPDNVISFAIRQTKVASFDKVVALLDTDIDWSDKLQSAARKAKIEMVGSTPCLEGLLLSILGKQVPGPTAACKRAIRELLGIDLTEWESYAGRFSKPVLEEARSKVSSLDNLIKKFEGQS